MVAQAGDGHHRAIAINDGNLSLHLPQPARRRRIGKPGVGALGLHAGRILLGQRVHGRAHRRVELEVLHESAQLIAGIVVARLLDGPHELHVHAARHEGIQRLVQLVGGGRVDGVELRQLQDEGLVAGGGRLYLLPGLRDVHEGQVARELHRAERVAHLDVLLRRQVVGLVGHRAQKLGAGGVDLLAAGAQGERQNEAAQNARHGAEQNDEGRRGGEDHELTARFEGVGGDLPEVDDVEQGHHDDGRQGAAGQKAHERAGGEGDHGHDEGREHARHLGEGARGDAGGRARHGGRARRAADEAHERVGQAEGAHLAVGGRRGGVARRERLDAQQGFQRYYHRDGEGGQEQRHNVETLGQHRRDMGKRARHLREKDDGKPRRRKPVA